ncbi:hypothetical protein [Burkholderia sp. S171]|uniref:hypothetical protein n=1 Tax=Burkholderia sp. S171 TaxID=1641860 RepID=UPI00131D3AA8|nr:hypothetical protein [Burkholderia sp. S171]
MALSLGVQAGSQVKIGSSILHILKISNGGKSISVKLNDQTFDVGNQQKIEILPSVFVICGVVGDWDSSSKSRLALDAPRSVKIERVDPGK